jgi:hypothetical protein
LRGFFVDGFDLDVGIGVMVMNRSYVGVDEGKERKVGEKT